MSSPLIIFHHTISGSVIAANQGSFFFSFGQLMNSMTTKDFHIELIGWSGESEAIPARTTIFCVVQFGTAIWGKNNGHELRGLHTLLISDTKPVYILIPLK
jgi:hypothetical protein